MPKPNWRLLSFVLISFLLLLSLLNWQRFPFFLDIYYHLNVMRGFDSAGGVVNHSFWELAPSGNVHLYPPLLHILLLIPYKLGVNLLFIARSFSIASFIALLLTFYFVVSRLFSKKLGFFAALAACVPYTFFLKATITIPAILVLILLLLAFYAIENQRKIAASLLISASFYTQLGMPWIGVIAFLIYGLLRREKMRFIISTLLLSAIFSAPILIHLFANLDKLEGLLGIKAKENELFEIYPMLYLFALIGLLKGRVLRGHGLFFAALFIGMLPMVINYRYRLISAEGLLPVIFFAGAGIAAAYDLLCRFLELKNVRPGVARFYILSFFIFIGFFSPTVSLYTTPISGDKELQFYLRDSTAANLLPFYKRHLRPLEINLYNKEVGRWVEIIENNTAPDDIICSNYTYVGGMLSAFSGRANAARLFYEIKAPASAVYEFKSSKLVLWMKEPDGSFSGNLRKCIEKYKFKEIARTDSAVILLKNDAAKSKPAKPVIPAKIAFAILFLASSVICYDLTRERNKFNNLSKSSLE